MKKTIDCFSDQLIRDKNIFKNGDDWLKLVNTKIQEDQDNEI